MLAFMLDTNICIQVIREHPPALLGRFNAEAERLCISAITLAELHYGAENSARPESNRVVVEAFAARLDCLGLDREASRHYGAIRAALRRQGQAIGNNDLLIAAHARSRGLTLVTNNRREFDRVDGLMVEDWLGDARGT